MLIFCQKCADISKIKRVLALKGIYSEIALGCVFAFQVSIFKRNSNEF